MIYAIDCVKDRLANSTFYSEKNKKYRFFAFHKRYNDLLNLTINIQKYKKKLLSSLVI